MAKFKTFFSRLPQQTCQLVVLVLAKIILQPFTWAKAPLNLNATNLQRPCLIVANHRRAFDPFAICSSLPFKTIWKMLPIGFITSNGFYDSPLRPFLWLMGCYPARNPNGKHRLAGIDASLHLIETGYSIFIFPEGTRVRNMPRGKAHSGVIRIHQAVPNMPMLLAHIEYYPGLRNWLGRRRRTISYAYIDTPTFTHPESVLNAIYRL